MQNDLIFGSYKSSDNPHLLQGQLPRLIFVNESSVLWESEQIHQIRGLSNSPNLLYNPAIHWFILPTTSGLQPTLFFGFSWMFSKCHGKCQQSLNQWPTDICPCLVSQPPVSLDLKRGAYRPSPCLCHVSFPSRIFTHPAQGFMVWAPAFLVTNL